MEPIVVLFNNNGQTEPPGDYSVVSVSARIVKLIQSYAKIVSLPSGDIIVHNKFEYLFAKAVKILLMRPAIKNSNIDKTSRVCAASHVVHTVVGKHSYIGSNCTVVNCNIGSFCSIADNNIIGGASHPTNWVSSSPVFHEGHNIMNKNYSSHKFRVTEKTIIGNDVWIGNNCIIRSGIIIGDGAVVGMGSVVTKNVAPYMVVAGNPARVIRQRLNDDIVESLLKIKWWDLQEHEIKYLSEYITQPDLFIEMWRQKE